MKMSAKKVINIHAEDYNEQVKKLAREIGELSIKKPDKKNNKKLTRPILYEVEVIEEN